MTLSLAASERRDYDSGHALERAADLAAAAGHRDRAVAAYRLAEELWTTTGRQDRLAALQRKTSRL